MRISPRFGTRLSLISTQGHKLLIPLDAVMIVSNDRVESFPEIAGLPRVISVSGKFDYLSDGDIIGFHPKSKRFRTLYRRTSGHNSFLVTDRCNHYCLMCSQPPKDIDDRWILGEIRTALPIIDKDTRSLGFTVENHY